MLSQKTIYVVTDCIRTLHPPYWIFFSTYFQCMFMWFFFEVHLRCISHQLPTKQEGVVVFALLCDLTDHSWQLIYLFQKFPLKQELSLWLKRTKQCKRTKWYTSCVGSFSPSYIIDCINKTQHGNFCFFQSFFKTSKWHTVYCWTGALLSCTFRTILPHRLGRLLPWLHESVLEIVLFTKTHLVQFLTIFLLFFLNSHVYMLKTTTGNCSFIT